MFIWLRSYVWCSSPLVLQTFLVWTNADGILYLDQCRRLPNIITQIPDTSSTCTRVTLLPAVLEMLEERKPLSLINFAVQVRISYVWPLWFRNSMLGCWVTSSISVSIEFLRRYCIIPILQVQVEKKFFDYGYRVLDTVARKWVMSFLLSVRVPRICVLSSGRDSVLFQLSITEYLQTNLRLSVYHFLRICGVHLQGLLITYQLLFNCVRLWTVRLL